MNSVLMPSLVKIALVKIATTLWNQADIRDLIIKLDFKKSHINWLKVEKNVIQKTWLLPLANSLKMKILGIIKPIGLEIFNWLKYNKRSCQLAVHLPHKLSWTPHGTLDWKKTTEALMDDETLAITERYQLACIYCFKKDVEILWERMPENDQGYFYSADDPGKLFDQHQLVVFWTYDMKGEMAKISHLTILNTTPYQHAFQTATVLHDKVAAEYFFNKLTSDEREAVSTFVFGFFLCDANDVDVFLRLVSQLKLEKQLEMFEAYARDVLYCLLDWPWQGLFIEMMNRVLIFLTDQNYYYLLDIIARKMNDDFKDYDYQKLFQEFWLRIPMNYKKYVIEQCATDSLLRSLFDAKDKKNISLIFKDSTLEEKENMLFSHEGIFTCKNLFLIDEEDLFEFFIGECILSQEKMITFKYKCKMYDAYYGWSLDTEMPFYHFLDGLIQKYILKQT